MITHKYPDRQRELTRLDVRVMRIFKVVEHLYWWLWMEPVVITEIIREKPGYNGPHRGGRAIDIAIPVKAGVEGAEKIRKVINILFPYGVSGYDTIPDIRHGNAPHCHIQVKPN